MAALSKLTSTLDYNCYELAHPWTTSCSHAWAHLFVSSLLESGKIYGALYLFSRLVVVRKYSIDAILQSLSSAFRSSIFLTYNVFFLVLLICVFRGATKRLYLEQTTLAAGLLSSLLAIFIEKPNRRGMLSLYMLNIFSEVLFNFLISRSLIPSIPHGDVLLYAIGVAGHTFLLNEVNGNDPISKALKFLIGTQEFLSFAPKKCTHGNSCGHYATAGFVKPFLVGYLGRCALSILSSNPLQLLKNPDRLLAIVLDQRNVKQGLSLGGMVATFRSIQCYLRPREVDARVSRAAAGFVAALWIRASKNRSLSLYVFWKTVETYYLLGHSEGLLPNIPFSRELIYATSSGLMLLSAVLEPHHIRSSYLQFLNNLTGQALSKVNRYPVATLGFNSTVSWPDYFPYDLDLTKVSKRFMEHVVVWS